MRWKKETGCECSVATPMPDSASAHETFGTLILEDGFFFTLNSLHARNLGKLREVADGFYKRKKRKIKGGEKQ